MSTPSVPETLPLAPIESTALFKVTMIYCALVTPGEVHRVLVGVRANGATAYATRCTGEAGASDAHQIVHESEDHFVIATTAAFNRWRAGQRQVNIAPAFAPADTSPPA